MSKRSETSSEFPSYSVTRSEGTVRTFPDMSWREHLKLPAWEVTYLVRRSLYLALQSFKVDCVAVAL